MEPKQDNEEAPDANRKIEFGSRERKGVSAPPPRPPAQPQRLPAVQSEVVPGRQSLPMTDTEARVLRSLQAENGRLSNHVRFLEKEIMSMREDIGYLKGVHDGEARKTRTFRKRYR